MRHRNRLVHLGASPPRLSSGTACASLGSLNSSKRSVLQSLNDGASDESCSEVEPASETGPPTCGLRISEKEMLKSLKTWTSPLPAQRKESISSIQIRVSSSHICASQRFT